MPEQAPEEDNSARGLLAFEMRRLREKSGKSLAQLAADTSYDRTYLNRLENGERFSQLPVIEALDEVYETGGYLARLWKIARLDVFPDQYKLFMRYEAKAVVMHKYMMVMPGLFQTEDYAREVLSSDQELIDQGKLEEQVTARMGRQEILRRSPPPKLRVILDESVLRRRAADPQTWRGQLDHLLTASRSRATVIQVLPFSAGVHDLMGGSLSLLWMPEGNSVAYREGSKSGDLLEDADEVLRLHLSYDQVRDQALPPTESMAFIQRLLESA